MLTLNSKPYLFLSFFLISVISASAQEPQFTWLGGNAVWNEGPNGLPYSAGIYGTKRIGSVTNQPGQRNFGSVSGKWVDGSGKLWMFGGSGSDAVGKNGLLNDLWNYNPATSEWTWMGGSERVNQRGIYGIKGIASPENIPGARSGFVSWKDQSGNLWLFGGEGYDRNGDKGRLNDMWKYNVSSSSWTWVSGSDIRNQLDGPGARSYSTSWVDGSGNFWLYGGISVSGPKSDLWKFNPTSNVWTNMGGGNFDAPVYGTKGVGAPGNKPGHRDFAYGWTDQSGNLWMFGGFCSTCPSNLTPSVIWKYDVFTGWWTWMGGNKDASSGAGVYGTKGVGSVNNTPGWRAGHFGFTDSNGDLVLFGGLGTEANGNFSLMDDVWKYEISTGKWTWLAGSNTGNKAAIFGAKGEASVSFTPGATWVPGSQWYDGNGALWLFGPGNSNSLWKYNLGQSSWAWINGSPVKEKSPVNYGTKGTSEAATYPGGRNGSSTWTSSSEEYWLFGGSGYDRAGDIGLLNDLWRYEKNRNQWTWVSGLDQINKPGVYGIKGVASSDNFPGARTSAASWTDNQGNLWLFGGEGYDRLGVYGSLNDLWKFDKGTLQWIWINGSDQISQFGNYPTLGQGTNDSNPGSRKSSSVWKDSNGDLYLFGGEGFGNGSFGYLNDLWKFEISSGKWFWIGGTGQSNQAGVYGQKNSGAGSNTPGSRKSAVNWTDDFGNFWLFGGEGLDKNAAYGLLNDLWMYDKTTKIWTWIAGGDTQDQIGIYGTKGMASVDNFPGARRSAFGWTDEQNDLWLSGGFMNGSNGENYFNDVWKFNTESKTWVWLAGSEQLEQNGVYGTKGSVGADNILGARESAAVWYDNFNNVLLFGGLGIDKNGARGELNDLWNIQLLKSQSIDFSEFSDKTYGDLSFNLTSISSSGLTVTYTSSDSTVAKVDGLKVTIVRAGSVTITANQGGDEIYLPALSVGRTLKIKKAPLNINIDSKSKNYGDPTPSLTFTYSGFKFQDNSNLVDVSPAIATAATLSSSVGIYAITGSGGSDDNYEFVFNNSTLTINKSPLTITVENQSRVFGAANPEFTFRYSGFKLNENQSVINSLPKTTTLATKSSDSGTYTITISGGEDDNYSLILIDGILTIKPAAQIISFEKLGDVVESVGAINLTATSVSGLPVEFMTANPDKILIVGAKATIRQPGSVTIIANQLGNLNYLAAPSVSQTFCINPKKPRINSLGEGTDEVLLISSSSFGNQWYRNEVLIEGAVDFTFKVSSEGIYRIKINIDGCLSEFSDGYNLIVTGGSDLDNEGAVSIFPNPTNGEVFVKIPEASPASRSEIDLLDGLGRVVKSVSIQGQGGSLSVYDQPIGIYFLKIRTENRTFLKKLTRQ